MTIVTYLMEMLAAPLGGVLARMAVKDSEIALASDPAKVVNERVGTARAREPRREWDKGWRDVLLHRAPTFLVAVDGDADCESRV